MVTCSELQGEDSACWPFNEVDLVGVVVHISGTQHQTVYIANEHAEVCAVQFWGGLEVSQPLHALFIRDSFRGAR